MIKFLSDLRHYPLKECLLWYAQRRAVGFDLREEWFQ